MCFDGLLAILAPPKWAQLWKNGVVLLPGPTELLTEAIDLTERYQREALNSMRMLFGLEVLMGLLMLRLAARAKKRG